jgi:hypothetical protein
MSVKKNDPHYPNPYSSGGGHTQPLAVTTHGRKYRVRDDVAGGTVWGKNLDYQQALKLKERVCGERKSKNAIIEDMAIALESHPTTVVAAPAVVDHDAAVRAAYEAGRRAALPIVAAPAAPSPNPEPPNLPPNGASTHVELDATDLADDGLIDSELDAL